MIRINPLDMHEKRVFKGEHKDNNGGEKMKLYIKSVTPMMRDGFEQYDISFEATRVSKPEFEELLKASHQNGIEVEVVKD